jgi:hypothetical protein
MSEGELCGRPWIQRLNAVATEHQYRARGQPQGSLRDLSHQETVEPRPAMSRHHDQAHLMNCGVSGDLAPRVAELKVELQFAEGFGGKVLLKDFSVAGSDFILPQHEDRRRLIQNQRRADVKYVDVVGPIGKLYRVIDRATGLD